MIFRAKSSEIDIDKVHRIVNKRFTASRMKTYLDAQESLVPDAKRVSNRKSAGQLVGGITLSKFIIKPVDDFLIDLSSQKLKHGSKTALKLNRSKSQKFEKVTDSGSESLSEPITGPLVLVDLLRKQLDQTRNLQSNKQETVEVTENLTSKANSENFDLNGSGVSNIQDNTTSDFLLYFRDQSLLNQTAQNDSQPFELLNSEELPGSSEAKGPKSYSETSEQDVALDFTSYSASIDEITKYFVGRVNRAQRSRISLLSSSVASFSHEFSVSDFKKIVKLQTTLQNLKQFFTSPMLKNDFKKNQLASILSFFKLPNPFIFSELDIDFGQQYKSMPKGKFRRESKAVFTALRKSTLQLSKFAARFEELLQTVSSYVEIKPKRKQGSQKMSQKHLKGKVRRLQNALGSLALQLRHQTSLIKHHKSSIEAGIKRIISGIATSKTIGRVFALITCLLAFFVF